MKQKDNSFQSRVDLLLQEGIIEASAIGIPVSKRIDSSVLINTRAKNRLGACKYKKSLLERKHFTIEIGSALNIYEDKVIKEVIVHEILHTCIGCQDHGKKWKIYARRMNEKYGYNIKRTYDVNQFHETMKNTHYRYKISCSKCNVEIYRHRASNLIKYPERYRCKACNGKFKVEELIKGDD